MIKITRTDTKEIKKFQEEEWKKADIEHYGQVVDWTTKKFHLKATDDGKIVGSLRMRIKAGVAHIERLIVIEAKRRGGVGRMLMQEAEEISRKNNVHKVDLITGEGWEAEHFYESLGYKITAKLPRHNFKVDFVAFTKFLN